MSQTAFHIYQCDFNAIIIRKTGSYSYLKVTKLTKGDGNTLSSNLLDPKIYHYESSKKYDSTSTFCI